LRNILYIINIIKNDVKYLVGINKVDFVLILILEKLKCLLVSFASGIVIIVSVQHVLVVVISNVGINI
tara:strand:- start:350 stop:553 length:204 start_codon:yes stop_codon:yes gene_type:complete